MATLNNTVSRRMLEDMNNYSASFDTQLANLYNQLQNNKPQFNLDLGKDPMYMAERDKYQNLGKLAMKDTQGQAAALTGGYGNTYGQRVGQQTYQNYLDRLDDSARDIYGLAYQRYRDRLADFNSNMNLQIQREQEDYDRYMAQQQLKYNAQVAQEQQEYEAAKYAEEQEWQRQLQAAQEAREQALFEMQMANYYGGGSSGGGSSGGGRSGGGRSGGGGGSGGYSSDTASIQRQLNAMGANLAVDGIWGPLTQAAYEKYMGGGSSGGFGYSDVANVAWNMRQDGQSQRSIDDYLRAEIAAGTVSNRQATEIRDSRNSSGKKSVTASSISIKPPKR